MVVLTVTPGRSCTYNAIQTTVLEAFLEAVSNHGLPSRVRGDQGVENVDIA